MKVLALASSLFVATQAVSIGEPDLIAMALAQSMSNSAQHLVQLASALETNQGEPEEPIEFAEVSEPTPIDII